MQICYSRIAGYTRRACLRSHLQTRLHVAPHGARYASEQVKIRRVALKDTFEKSGAVKKTGSERAAALPSVEVPPKKHTKDIEAWLTLLEPAFPPRLRDNGRLERRAQYGLKDLGDSENVGDIHDSQELSPRATGRLLELACYNFGHDLLTHLAHNEGRWGAVVWLVNHIVDNIWKGDQSGGVAHPEVLGAWKSLGSLTALTEKAGGITLGSPGEETLPRPRIRHAAGRHLSMDELTNESSPHYQPLSSRVDHAILGQIWWSLGNMIVLDAEKKASTNAPIAPEILEIIALLHHCGIMPASIYNYQPSPSDDLSVARKPPTLHLLSSHILTSLTDAAWRAHEKVVVEEAKSKGGQYTSMRPEIPGSMYKVHVAGLGHEAWLELVLWSCLQGGWIVPGAHILQTTGQSQKDSGVWKLLSWHELTSPIVGAEQKKKVNWSQLAYLFDNHIGLRDPIEAKQSKELIQRSISTEVVVAFVDALLCDIYSGVGERGVPPVHVVKLLHVLKELLERNDMSLGNITWDAIIVRLASSEGVDIEKFPGLAEMIMKLSPAFGEELTSRNTRAGNKPKKQLPDYILDGTASPIGLMHRIMYAYIRQGNLPKALRAFESLRNMTDRNMQKSLEHFFLEQKRLDSSMPTSEDFSFDSRYMGIDYPAFHPQLPSTLLAPFLDLITDAQALDVGLALLQSDDPDGPLIPSDMYADPIVGPTLILFASALDDESHTHKIMEAQAAAMQLRHESGEISGEPTLLTLLYAQIRLKNWDNVDRVLVVMKTTSDYPHHDVTVATMAQAVLREVSPQAGIVPSPEPQSHLRRAIQCLEHLMRDSIQSESAPEFSATTTLHVLASINEQWRDLCWRIHPMNNKRRYRLSPKAFNTILDGVTQAYGSEQGRLFLSRFYAPAEVAFEHDFWSQETLENDVEEEPIGDEAEPRDAESDGVDLDERGALLARAKMPPYRPTQFRGPSRQFKIQTYQKSLHAKTKTVSGLLYGDFKPTIAAILIILRKGLQEHPNDWQAAKPYQTWALEMLVGMGMDRRLARNEVRGVAWKVRRQLRGEKAQHGVSSTR